ncbi:MAG: DUF721 domain-containing protein [Desulfobacteraceae bacterium]|nr:DUF721 domain-containing protein [Desulfobacteraceae bacterium]
MNKKKKNLTHIGSILDKALDNFRPSSDTEMTQIWSLWDQAVGDGIAQNAKPAAFKDGTLIVHVSSSVWLQQLRFIQQDLHTNLNLALGRPLVKELRFKIAALHN